MFIPTLFNAFFYGTLLQYHLQYMQITQKVTKVALQPGPITEESVVNRTNISFEVEFTGGGSEYPFATRRILSATCAPS